jgi:hypothetical protein
MPERFKIAVVTHLSVEMSYACAIAFADTEWARYWVAADGAIEGFDAAAIEVLQVVAQRCRAFCREFRTFSDNAFVAAAIVTFSLVLVRAEAEAVNIVRKHKPEGLSAAVAAWLDSYAEAFDRLEQIWALETPTEPAFTK